MLKLGVKVQCVGCRSQLRGTCYNKCTLTTVVGLFSSSLAPGEPCNGGVCSRVRIVRSGALSGGEGYFVSGVARCLRSRGVRKACSLPSSISGYTGGVKLGPEIDCGRSGLERGLLLIVGGVNLRRFGISSLVKRRVSLVISSKVPIIRGIAGFSVVGSLSLIRKKVR